MQPTYGESLEDPNKTGWPHYYVDVVSFVEPLCPEHMFQHRARSSTHQLNPTSRQQAVLHMQSQDKRCSNAGVGNFHVAVVIQVVMLFLCTAAKHTMCCQGLPNTRGSQTSRLMSIMIPNSILKPGHAKSHTAHNIETSMYRSTRKPKQRYGCIWLLIAT